MKTVSMRLRGMKGELEELGEESEGVENISQMQGRILNLTHGAVNIFDNQGEFRSTYDILMDIAAVHKDLTSTEQADLIETIAGKHRANDVAAFLSNAQNAADMVTAAQNSAGSAANENAKYLESLQGRITSLQASLQTLSVSFLNSDFLSGAVGGVNDFVQAITGLINEVGPIPALMGAVGAAMSVMDKGPIYFDNTTKQVKILGKSLSELKGIFSSLGSGDSISALASSFGDDNNPLKIIDKRLEQEKKAIQKYNELMTPDANGNRKTTKQDAMDIAFSGQQQGLRDYVSTLGDAKVEMEEWEKVSKRAALQTMAQSNSFKSGIMILDDYNKKTKEQRIEMSKMAELSGSNVGNYISTLNGADASIGGLAKTTALATAKTIAMDAALSLAQGGLMMLGSMALDFAVNGLMSIINRASEVKEAVEDATQSFANNKKQLSDNKQSFADAAQTYAELSNGVSRTGENLSLSATQYDEYANAVNAIADMTPSLVSGYDAQGNAILNIKGNVEALTDAYNDLIIAENNKLLNGDGEDYGGLSDISEDLANDVKSLSDQKRVADSIQEIFDSGNIDAESIRSNIRTTVKSTASAVRDELEAAGKEVENFDLSLPTFLWDDEKSAEYLSKAFQQFPDVLKGMVSDYESALDSSVSEMRSAMSAHMETAFLTDQYANIDDETYAMASSIVSGIDSAVIAQLNANGGEEGKQAVMNYVDNIMSAFDTAMSDTQRQQYEDAFNLADMFQAGDVSLGEYKRQLEDVSEMIDSLNVGDDVKNQLKLSLNIDDVKQQYDELYNYLTKEGSSLGEDAAKELINGLNAEEMTVALNMVADGEIDVSDLNVDDVRNKIQSEVERQRVLSFELDIEVETDSLAKLNTALSESNGQMGLTQESIEGVISRYADLEGYDPAGLFEKTTTGVRLNTDALEALERQYVETNKAAQDQKIDALVKQYADLKKARDDAAAAGDTDAVATNENRMKDLENEIHNAQMVKSAYEGMTSAYNEWINAKSAGESGDRYRALRDESEQMNEYASQGRFGRNDVQEYADIFFADGATEGWDADDYSAHWQEVVNAQNRYLTEGTEGAHNFINDIKDEFMTVNESGELELKPGVNVEDIADFLGRNSSFVELMFGETEELGLDFDIGIDEKSVDELVAESEAAAQAAQEALQQYLGEDFVIDSTVTVNEDGTNDAISQLDALRTQRDEINGSGASVEVKAQGVDAVNSAMQAVIAQKIQLEQPAFMSIDVSSVDTSMQDALSKAQEMQVAINELNTLQLTNDYVAEVDTEQLEAAKQKVDEIAQSIADNGDLKMKLGFEEGATVEDIKSKFTTDIGSIDVKFQGDTTQAEADINSLKDNQSIDVQVNLAGDDKIAALESKMNAIDNKTIDANVSLTGDDKIAALESKMNAIDNKTIDASVSLTGAEQIANLESKMNAIDNKTINVNVAVQNAQAITSLQNSINSIQNKVANVSVSTAGTESVQALTNAINTVTPKSVDVTANVSGTDEVNALTKAIKVLTGKVVSVTAKVSGTSAVNALRNAISGVQSKTVNITTYRTTVNRTTTGQGTVATGTATPKGAAFAYGTEGKSFKRGDWGIKSDGVALGGELGPELLVRDGKYRLIGENSAEFFKHKRGDIVFNAEQTREIFEKGRITGLNTRGQAFVNGTFPTQGNAYARDTSVTGGGSFAKPWGGGSSGTTVVNNTTNNYNYNTSKSSSNKSSSAKKAADEFKESLDWIEIAIDRVERAIDSLDKTATNTFLDFAERDGALLQQMQQVTNEINLQQQAYERYMAEANSVGLSADWQDKIKNGRIDIEVITDEGLKEQIDQFQEWYFIMPIYLVMNI